MTDNQPGKALLGGQEVRKSYGAQPVLEGVSLTIHDGDRIGLIGRNGSGKSTLLRILSGQIEADGGLVTRTEGLRVSFLSQQSDLDLTETVGAVLEDAASPRRKLAEEYHAALQQLAETPEASSEHARLQETCDALHHQVVVNGAWDTEQELKRISVALALPERQRVLAQLSGGELRRVDLAARLLERPDVLLLDEPTNHIDARSVEWIENFLEGYKGSCVLVTHDRYFLDRAVNRIVEIEFGGVIAFPGNYARFLEYKANLEDSRARTEKNRLHLIRRELAWYKRGAKARTSKEKARVQRLQAAQQESGPPQHREFTFEIPQPRRLGKTILEARHITHGYEDRVFFKDFSLLMQKAMRVGIVGPNGCGKTTLLRVLLGRERPQKGQVIHGDATEFIYVRQAHEAVKEEQTVLDYVSDGAETWEVDKRRINVPAYLTQFLFERAAIRMPVGRLSGGERNRLEIARQLLRGGNFLVLDEPTNDLDLYTLRVLEEAVARFDGCALIVSHDRYFLNRVCTHMLVFEGGGEVVQLTGNYDDYLLYRSRREAERKAQAGQAKARGSAAGKPVKRPRGTQLTWHEKQELQQMEARILEAEEAVARLQRAIHAPGFYEQDHAAVQKTLSDLEAAQQQVEALFERWEALEARR